MSDVAFVAGYFAATLVPAVAAARLVLWWRRGTLGTLLAIGAGLLAAWLGLGAFVQVALGPDFMAPMMD